MGSFDVPWERASASDVQAQLALTQAIRGAQVWYAEQGTLAGYTAEQAAAFDPQFTYVAGAPAMPDVVSVRGLADTTVVFVTQGGVGPMCISMNGELVGYGRVDAQTAQRCAGASW